MTARLAHSGMYQVVIILHCALYACSVKCHHDVLWARTSVTVTWHWAQRHKYKVWPQVDWERSHLRHLWMTTAVRRGGDKDGRDRRQKTDCTHGCPTIYYRDLWGKTGRSDPCKRTHTVKWSDRGRAGGRGADSIHWQRWVNA